MPRFAFVVFISRPRESKREMSCVYAHPFRVFFVWFRAYNLLIYFPKRTVRSFAENSERKARDSKDEEAIFEGASDRNPWAFLRSRSFSLTIELLCSKILSIEFLSSAQNALREE